MNRPAQEAYWLLIYFLAGGALGIFYGFLRPLRCRRSWPADLLFVTATSFAWVYLGFGVCGGDLRIGCLAGLFLGIFLFDRWPGRWMRPLFFGFWRLVAAIFGWIGRPVRNLLKKIVKFTKNIVATGKKSSIIRWKYPDHFVKRKGGSHYGKAGKHPEPYSHRTQEKQQADRGGSDLLFRTVSGGGPGTGKRDPQL
jgi:hypothetical protein